MSSVYIYETGLSWGGDVPTAEHDVKVSFTVAWGSPGNRDTMNPELYDEGSASEVENIKLVEVNGKPRPWGVYDGMIRNEDDEFESVVVEMLEANHLERMLEEACQIEEARRPD